ncbi:GntR family transcriptional regulator [Desulfosarcina ovata subsp. sediminis]|uniref:GntR family transcriptional regulator n=3 Tax=Desulfosarcina ovata TaxID=83564 RepID=A0A5K8A758_9BACT|nr:FadR/GntR family transcriptional regulator [Desulfosarcina ovata]BBO81227.1 GntR family transcriptional regulator [Desulfosarcina ovata subsp. sediminis]BBO88238.1 GntR family transcriptional regulator [Desulfosarcina ovata subsp. ovata]
MYSFEPIKQPKATEEVLAQLKEAILRGAYKEGDKLPSERELTSLFNVSRGVVREAIRGLQVSGYVEIKQGPLGGAYVKEITLGLFDVGFSDLFFSNKITITEVLNVRQYIEPEIARLAALNISDEFREKLEIALEQEKQSFKSADDLMKKLTAVHLILAEMCGNRLFEGIIISIISLTHRIIKAMFKDLLKLHGAGEHEDIVQAVMKGDSESAAKAMTLHGDSFGRVFLELEKSEGWLWGPESFNGPGKK